MNKDRKEVGETEKSLNYNKGQKTYFHPRFCPMINCYMLSFENLNILHSAIKVTKSIKSKSIIII